MTSRPIKEKVAVHIKNNRAGELVFRTTAFVWRVLANAILKFLPELMYVLIGTWTILIGQWNGQKS